MEVMESFFVKNLICIFGAVKTIYVLMVTPRLFDAPRTLRTCDFEMGGRNTFLTSLTMLECSPVRLNDFAFVCPEITNLSSIRTVESPFTDSSRSRKPGQMLDSCLFLTWLYWI